MKREWAGVARALRERDDCLVRGDEILWAGFKSRLAARPRAALPPWRFILTGAFAAAATLALLIPILVSRANPPAVRAWAKVAVDTELRIEKSSQFVTSPGNTLRAEAGTHLVRQSTNASRMELRLLSGGLLIDNQDPSVKNLIRCGPYLIEEWGTRYRVESGESGFSVRVESGKVRVSREGEQILLDAGERMERPWPSAPTRATAQPMGAQGPSVAKPSASASAPSLQMMPQTPAPDWEETDRGFHHRLMGKQHEWKGPSQQGGRLEVPLEGPLVWSKAAGPWALFYSGGDHIILSVDHRAHRLLSGLLTAPSAFVTEQGLWLLNSRGEIILVDPRGREASREKILSGNLWEGVRLDETRVALAGASPEWVVYSFAERRVLARHALPLAACGALSLRDGMIEIPTASGVVRAKP
jgi:hypothetical protein